MIPPFAELLTIHLKRTGASGSSFAERVGTSQSTMSRIIRGESPPDVDALDGWADALHLDGELRDQFILSGSLAHCPKPVLDLIGRLGAEPAALQKRIDKLTGVIEHQDAQLADLQRQIAELQRGSRTAPRAG